MAYADPSDVTDFDRELDVSDSEVFGWVFRLLDMAETLLSDEFDLAALVAAGRLTQIVMVESEMVAAVTRNPNAYASESSGVGGLSSSHTFLPEVAAGLLQVTDKQRGKITGAAVGAGSSGAAFTIRPAGHAPTLSPRW